MRFLFPAVAAATMAASASAAELAVSISIPVMGETGVSTTSAAYDCDGREVAATYINAGSVSLAVLNIDGETVVASNVIAASGAKYAGAQYIWWTKGEEADLYDLTEAGEDAPTASCAAKG